MKRTLMILSALCVGLISRAQAQTPENYTIGPGDVLIINVVNHPDLTLPGVLVLPDGKIQFPEVGELMVAGKTPTQVKQEIEKGLKRTRNNVFVTVSVKESHSRRVRVLGAVRIPGEYDLKPGYRLLDVVAVAQGLATKPELTTGRLIRNRDKVIDLHVADAVLKPNSDANLTLEVDDIIVLDALEKPKMFAFVMGKVTRPGAVIIDENTVLPAVFEQSGLPSDEAAPDQAYVLRGSQKLPLNLAKLLHGEADDSIASFKVQPGDMIFVPETTNRYALVGALTKTGYVRLPDNRPLTVFEAVNQAAPLSGADLAKTIVLREDHGSYTMHKINVDKMLRTGNSKENIALQAGDVIFVPTKGAKGFNVLDLLYPATLVFQLMR